MVGLRTVICLALVERLAASLRSVWTRSPPSVAARSSGIASASPTFRLRGHAVTLNDEAPPCRALGFLLMKFSPLWRDALDQVKETSRAPEGNWRNSSPADLD